MLSIDPAMLMRVRLRLVRIARSFSFHPEPLPDEAIVPCLTSELTGAPKFAQIRIAVGDNAFFFQLDVLGKQHLPWCRDSRVEDSEGLHVWINTRHAVDLQRANRYCHRFVFSPLGKGRKADRPFASWGLIPRATEDAPPVADDLFAIRAKVIDGRYRLVAGLHFDALNGLDLVDYPELGLYYAVIDRELGWQALQGMPDYSIDEVPGLWAQCHLAAS